MAEFTATDNLSSSEPSRPKTGRHSRFSPAEDLAILREFLASKPHLAAYGKLQTCYEEAARSVNANPHSTQKVTWKTVRDRYRILQEQFDKGDAVNQRMSGVGGEVGEVEELLIGMKEARDDLITSKGMRRAAHQAAEYEKVGIGEEIVEMSTTRRRSISKIKDACEQPGTTPKKTKRNLPINSSGEMDRFGAQLREADLARIEIERERLNFEGENIKADREERERDRQERKEERQKTQELEMENYKLLVSALGKK